MNKTTVMLATTSCWVPSARLGMALAKAGFRVIALCPLGHPLERTGAAQEMFTYRGLAPIASFTDALVTARPDLIVPGDDLATYHLHQVHAQCRALNADEELCALIERSLGSPDSFAVVRSRSRVIGVAAAEGVRVAHTEAIPHRDALEKWIARTALPAVLKSDGSSGGDGVKVVYTARDARRAFRLLSRPPHWIRAIKRAVVNRDTTLVRPALRRRPVRVNSQAYIAGHEATSTVACWRGRVLAAIHCEVLRKAEGKGPSTVLRLVDDAEMASAAQKIARRLNLSGIYGFDFMREAETGNACLIEVNPRATQVGHLTLGAGRDLPAALFAAVSGKELQPAPVVTEKDMIALFPSEWIRDSASPFLRSAYHDVPWEEAELVRACIRTRRRKVTWYSPKEDFRVFQELVSATYDGSAGGPP